MSRAKVVFAAFVAVLAVGVMASASASAATVGWMLGGKLLSQEGLNSAPLALNAVTIENIKLESGGLLILCKKLMGNGAEIRNPDIFYANSLHFTECETTTPNCFVPELIATVPVLALAELEGALAVRTVVRPETGITFATIPFTGESCSLAGNKSVTGDVELLAPEGQDERTDQRLNVNQPATGLLKIASNPVLLTGAVGLLLANGNAWSFL